MPSCPTRLTYYNRHRPLTHRVVAHVANALLQVGLALPPGVQHLRACVLP